MYGMTPWKDEVVQYPYRYKETQNSDGTVEHEPSPGTVMEQGTPQSATNFNHMENGIHDVHVAAAIFMQYQMHYVEAREKEVDERLDHHDAEFSAETGTVTLNNTNKVFFGFNNSGSTIALKTVRKTMNYDLDIEVVEVAGGQVGDVIVYDKQLNGFKLKFDDMLAIKCDKYQKDWPVHKDICMDADGNLTMGTGDGLFYVAEVDIPAREYEQQEESDQEGEGKAPVAKKLDMSQVTVTLWGLENPVAADDEEEE